MSQGRGSVGKAMLIMVALLCLLVHSAPVHAATYTVGDADGWIYDVVNWPNGKTFKAGDVLVFNYLPELHNVVEVDINGYNRCKAPAGSKVHNSGNDKITLVKGTNSFICTFEGHCLQGMKITVTAK
ncbi:hypothetical protein AAG906_007192 [Vitis piasezkii]|uniref:Basic blue protein n=1 Tax=Vitis vinifera TaxID=29760 RepID=A0A438HKV8_VITVI|nr:Basic blue protein [Vitis vinifera]